ncbi:MAG: ribosome biogenesis GTPase Der [bacterium]|nr:ribosome biogenesis GTPase Der [bacterium]
MKTVALVGCPNVGKSTIFNRLVGRKVAIVENTPGVTRDRIYGTVNYNDKSYHLIDTGGIDDEKNTFNNLVKIQTTLAIDESDVVIFIVDGLSQLTKNDYVIRDMLKKSNKEVILVINKIDNEKRKDNIYQYYELGFNNIEVISAEHNLGIRSLLDNIDKYIPLTTKEEIEDEIIKFSIIGRPNVGKSSLVNALLNEERLIVSANAGTTRDAIDTPFISHGKKYLAIDTAGIRKSGKIYENIEKYSLLRTMKAIEKSDVCVLVINSEEGVIEHDKHIAGIALENGKAIVIVVNKWDLISDKNNIKDYTTNIRNEFQFLPYASIVFLSAKTKKRIHTLLPEIDIAYTNRRKEIKTSILNDIINDAYMLNNPPSYKGKRLKIFFSHQTSTKPPKFILNVNNKNLVHFSYYRYLENKLRENIDFTGTPIILEFKNKNDKS